jgi:hypothetical protein
MTTRLSQMGKAGVLPEHGASVCPNGAPRLCSVEIFFVVLDSGLSHVSNRPHSALMLAASRPESMKVEFDAEDSARLPADVPNDVFTGIGQKPQRNEGVDHGPLKSSFWRVEIVPLHRHHRRSSGHGIVAILYANDEAAKILQRIA